nr:uncharacterized protein LOC120976180 [Aegilops tauschii subsp. strangulata]
MAFRDAARKPLLWLLPATLILATGGGERDAARRRLYAPTLLAAWLVLGVVTAVLAANGGRIMRFARWKRLLLRGGLLLALGLNAFCIFLALDAVADRLLGEQGPVSFAVARVVCALTAAAAHLDFGWVAVHGE